MSYEIPATLDREIDELEERVTRTLEGSYDPELLKGHRVPFGIYEQRRKGAFMVRVRCPAGRITPTELEAVASLSAEYGSGVLHLTTRQELQIHEVELRNVVTVVRRLRRAGLATRGGGGNTVRNVVASPESGLYASEVFDVTPYALALTNRFLAEPDSWSLPRKYKIAFSCSEEDSGHAAFSDLGFVAVYRAGQDGFRVYAAGGLGARSSVGHLLHEFAPARDVYAIAKAIKRVFDKFGNRRDRHAARLRFLWDALGEREFRARYEEELAAVRREDAPPLSLPALEPIGARPFTTSRSGDGTHRDETARDDGPEFERWKRRYARLQRDGASYAVQLPVFLGNLPHARARALARGLAGFGEDVVRVAFGQNLLLRNLPAHALGFVFQIARDTSELAGEPPVFGASIACAGADTCQLGLCRSRDALAAVHARLRASGLDLDTLGDFKLHISGCPNNCGQHALADLGFSGRANRGSDRLYPAYRVLVGSRLSGGGRLAEEVGDVSARELPGLVVRFLEDYLSRVSHFGSYSEYLEGQGQRFLREDLARSRIVPPFEADPAFYTDWGASEPFSSAGRGEGECSAGPPAR